MFERETERIRTVLVDRALRIEHVGSTSVPELPAKPIIDILLVVAGSENEPQYAALETAGYRLHLREPGWYEHRLFKGPRNGVSLHVFSPACPEIERLVRLRNWLRTSKDDREQYARTKRALVARSGNTLRTTLTPRARRSNRSCRELGEQLTHEHEQRTTLRPRSAS